MKKHVKKIAFKFDLAEDTGLVAIGGEIGIYTTKEMRYALKQGKAKATLKNMIHGRDNVEFVQELILFADREIFFFFWLGFQKHGSGNRFQPMIVTCCSNKVITPNIFKCI